MKMTKPKSNKKWHNRMNGLYGDKFRTTAYNLNEGWIKFVNTFKSNDTFKRNGVTGMDNKHSINLICKRGFLNTCLETVISGQCNSITLKTNCFFTSRKLTKDRKSIIIRISMYRKWNRKFLNHY